MDKSVYEIAALRVMRVRARLEYPKGAPGDGVLFEKFIEIADEEDPLTRRRPSAVRFNLYNFGTPAVRTRIRTKLGRGSAICVQLLIEACFGADHGEL